MKHTFIGLALILGLSTAQASGAGLRHRDIQVNVTEKGFEPKQIDIKPNTVVTLKVTRKTDNTCAGTIVIADRDIEKELPLNKTVRIQLGKLEKGEIRFACGMKMVKGVIVVR